MSARIGSPFPIAAPQPWMDQAACRSEDPELFFAEHGQRINIRAKAVCHACPVAVQCARYALDHDEPYGVWGGLSPIERKQMLQRVPTTRVVCGTESGARTHYARGEKPCAACLDASRAASARRARERRAQQKAAAS